MRKLAVSILQQRINSRGTAGLESKSEDLGTGWSPNLQIWKRGWSPELIPFNSKDGMNSGLQRQDGINSGLQLRTE